MNKTVTINLSGMIFHIDENAYDVLKKYLEKLKSHFSATQGRDEIIADIESRIAEIFVQKMEGGKSAILQEDVDVVMKEMGNPEEIGDHEEDPKSEKYTNLDDHTDSRKRFFRNPEEKILAGVCGGIAAYFNIDPIWLRLAFVLAFFFGGSGFLIYIILWVIIPKANTLSERMQMKGERVNISNIEKNVKEEMDDLARRMKELGKDFDSEKFKSQAKSQGDKILLFLREVLGNLFGFVSRVFGFFLTILSLGVIIMLMLGIFASIGTFQFIIPGNMLGTILTATQSAWIIIGMILAVGIPFILLFLNGIKILFKVKLDLKKIGAIMLIFWLTGIGILVTDGFSIGKEFRNSGTMSKTQSLKTNSNIIHLIITPDNDPEYDVEFFDLIQPENSDSIFCPTVDLDIETSNTDSFQIITKYMSRGSSAMEARILASEINYSVSGDDSILIIPRWFVINTNKKYRGQHVKIILKVPVGKQVEIPKSFRHLMDNVSNVNDLGSWEIPGHTFLMTKNGLSCLNCTEDELNHKSTEEQINDDLERLHQHIKNTIHDSVDTIK